MISPSIEFYVNSINKCEDRGEKGKEVTSCSVNMIDNKDKNMNEKNWKPTSNIYINILGTSDIGLQFGKKYKVSFEEVK